MNHFSGFTGDLFGQDSSYQFMLNFKNRIMRAGNTFGVHFTLRMNKQKNGKAPIYVRITVNGTRIELSLKKKVKISDWNINRGMAKNKNAELKMLNGVLEQTRGLFSGYYQEM